MRVLIADDNPRVRRGTARLLSGDEDLQVCGEASDSNETLQKAGELKPSRSPRCQYARDEWFGHGAPSRRESPSSQNAALSENL